MRELTSVIDAKMGSSIIPDEFSKLAEQNKEGKTVGQSTLMPYALNAG